MWVGEESHWLLRLDTTVLTASPGRPSSRSSGDLLMQVKVALTRSLCCQIQLKFNPLVPLHFELLGKQLLTEWMSMPPNLAFVSPPLPSHTWLMERQLLTRCLCCQIRLSRSPPMPSRRPTCPHCTLVPANTLCHTSKFLHESSCFVSSLA